MDRVLPQMRNVAPSRSIRSPVASRAKNPWGSPVAARFCPVAAALGADVAGGARVTVAEDVSLVSQVADGA